MALSAFGTEQTKNIHKTVPKISHFAIQQLYKYYKCYKVAKETTGESHCRTEGLCISLSRSLQAGFSTLLQLYFYKQISVQVKRWRLKTH